MRIMSWNLNGIRAVDQKVDGGLRAWLPASGYDIYCFQEHRLSSADQLDEGLADIPGYDSFWSFARDLKGSYGVVTYARQGLTLNAHTSFGLGSGAETEFDSQGRLMITDHMDFVLVNVYVPSGGKNGTGVKAKMRFYGLLERTVVTLRSAGRKVVIIGDMNTAHNEIDVHKFERHVNDSGFLAWERSWYDHFFSTHKFVDTFRHFNPELAKQYTWWDVRKDARKYNSGWRLDYALCDPTLVDSIGESTILADVMGSDHCPIGLTINGLTPFDRFPAIMAPLLSARNQPLGPAKKRPKSKAKATVQTVLALQPVEAAGDGEESEAGTEEMNTAEIHERIEEMKMSLSQHPAAMDLDEELPATEEDAKLPVKEEGDDEGEATVVVKEESKKKQDEEDAASDVTEEMEVTSKGKAKSPTKQSNLHKFGFTADAPAPKSPTKQANLLSFGFTTNSPTRSPSKSDASPSKGKGAKRALEDDSGSTASKPSGAKRQRRGC